MLIIRYHHSDYLLWLIITLNIFYISNNPLSTFTTCRILGACQVFPQALPLLRHRPQEYITFMSKADFLLSYKAQIL